MSFRFPTLFVSHGTPMHAFGEDPYQQMLFTFASSMPKPKAVVVLSAHSVSSDDVFVLMAKTHQIQHDFAGFPDDLYQIQYQCQGDPDLSEKVHSLLVEAGFQTKYDQHAPLDHGVWIPLKHLYPKGDVKVVRVSLPLNLIPAKILKMGHALASLREEGVMVLASGGAVHNLQKLAWAKKNSNGLPWAKQFEDWLITSLQKKNVDALVNAEEHPDFYNAHPSAEHFLPLLFAVGATLPGDEVTILNRGIEYDTLSMLCFSLNHAQSSSIH